MSFQPRSLEPGFTADVVRVDERRWRDVLSAFDDANLYQAWAYDAVRQGEQSLCHCVVSRAGSVVAAAQARLAGLPGLRAGAAYVRWGPMWRRIGSRADPLDLRMCLRAMRNELVLKRGLFLRVFPLLFDDEVSGWRGLLEEEGFAPAPGDTPQRTLLLGLEPSLEDIRKSLEHKWRNRLSRAERNELECSEGSDDASFGAFIELYRSLLDRKRFKEPNDIREFRVIQERLPDDQKLRIFLTGKNGAPSCGAICSALGGTGVYLFGACNESGLATNGSYLIQWKAIQWFKQQGCRVYNLNGINPESNPGTYHFKAGVAGRTGRDVRYLGRFDAYGGSLTATGVHLAAEAYRSFQRLLSRRANPVRAQAAGAPDPSASQAGDAPR